MPHITVEYTETITLDIPKMIDEMHYNLADQDTVDVHAIKSRAIPVQYSIVGDGKDRDKFVHVTVKLLTGRPEELRRKMGEDLKAVALKYLGNTGDVALSIEVAEMNPATYVK